MKVEKKQLPQFIILGVLVLVCIGFVSFQLSGPNNEAKVPLKKADKDTVTAKSASVKAVETGPEQVALNVFPQLNAAVPRRDPFQPVKMPMTSTEGEESNVDQPKKSSSHNNTTSLPDGSSKVPRISVNPFNPFGRGEGPSVTVVKPPRDVDEDKGPEFVLTGIVRGEENVAVIRSGKEGRYVVKQGQVIEGRYKVIRVSDDSATLVDGNRHIRIKLGGD